MSLIVAIKDKADVVIAADGRVLGEHHEILSESALKTVALNAHLCLGIAGRTSSMRDILGCLGLKSRRSDPCELLSTCQAMDCPIDADYSDARHELSAVYRWMTRRRLSRGPCRGDLPDVLLAGRGISGTALGRWGHSPWVDWRAPAEGTSHVAVGILPPLGTSASCHIEWLITEERSTAGAERRLTEVIRRSADHFGASGPIGQSVVARRLNNGFQLVRSP